MNTHVKRLGVGTAAIVVGGVGAIIGWWVMMKISELDIGQELTLLMAALFVAYAVGWVITRDDDSRFDGPL